MKRLVLSALFSVMYGAGALAQSCMTPPEKIAVDVVVFKTSLMVAALSCGVSDKYNSFMAAFQPYVLAEQQAMDGYFARAGGLAGQTQEDGFLTMLANDQSQDGLAAGEAYCDGEMKLFDAVLALQTPDDLVTFVAAHPLPDPLATAMCPTSVPDVAKPRRLPRRATPPMVIASTPLPAPAGETHVASANETPPSAAPKKPGARKPAKAAAPVLVQI